MGQRCLICEVPPTYKYDWLQYPFHFSPIYLSRRFVILRLVTLSFGQKKYIFTMVQFYIFRK